MSAAVCPSCGVAVVPGYTKCPKCQAALPSFRGNKRLQTGAGGTAVEDRRLPIPVIAASVGGLLLLIVLVKACSGGGDDEAIAQVMTTTTNPPVPAGPATVVQPQTDVRAQPTPVREPVVDTATARAELDRVLRLKRFWAAIETTGTQVEVRSSFCDDPAMPSVIDGVLGTLRGAGLTRLRCVAQSGTVVFERNL